MLGGILPMSSALAQTTEARQGSGVITGRVSNGGTGQYLQNAVVVVNGAAAEARTASDGFYRISGLAPGTYTVTVAFSGLNTETRTVVITEGKNELMDFELGSEIYILGEFIVSSEREGSAKAVQEKREATNMKNIVAADSFGNMVDGNIGELMKNLPGITVDYDGEDASAMRFRGMDPALASVTMDGNPIATSPGGDTRSFSLRDFAVQNIETIEVNFAPTPEQPSNSMGGSINFKTKSAFNQKGRRIRLDANLSLNTAELEYQKTPGGARTPDRKLMPGFTLAYSEAFGKNHPIGVSLVANFSQRYRFNNSYTLPGGYAFSTTELAANNGIATPEMKGQIPSVLWTERGQADERRYVGLNLDYKLSDSTSVFLYNSLTIDRGLGGYAHSVRVTGGNQGADASFDKMTSSASASLGMGSSVFNNNTKTFGINPGVKHRFGDLEIAYDAYLSRSEYEPDHDRNYSVGYSLGALGLTIDGISGNATGVLTQTSGPNYKNIANYHALSMTQDYTSGIDEQRGAKIDGKKPFSFWGVPVEIQLGGRYNEQTRDIERYYRKWDLTGNSASSAFFTAAEPNLQQFADPYFGDQWKFDVPIPNWISPYLVYDYFTTQRGQFYNNYIDGVLTNDRAGFIQGSYSRERYGDRYTQEQIYAGYGMITAKLRPNLVFLGGARYEFTKMMATGVQYDSTSNIFGVGRRFDTVTPGSPYYGITDQQYLASLLFTPIEKRKSYEKVFPNAQLKYEPTKNLIFRAAYTTNMGKPDFTAILPSDTVYEHINLIRRNNTKLMPQEGTNYDFSVEYYLPRSGLVSVNVFYQEIENYIYTAIYSEQHENGVTGQLEPWTVETRENAGKGQNQGAEFEYKQKLGFITNYLRDLEFRAVFSAANPEFQYLRRTGTPVYEDTPAAGTPAYDDYVRRVNEYMNSPQVYDTIDLPNIVKRSASVRLTYNGRRFSGSVAAFWRDDFVRTPNTATKAHTMQASDLRVDLNLTYKMSSHWSAYFDWRNVTDEADERSIFNRTGGYYTSGMVMNIGIKAAF
ncbi:MAG: TonB-dependent receptor [Nibricoccus sp.]